MTLTAWIEFMIFISPMIVPLIVLARRNKRLTAQAEHDPLPFQPQPRPLPGMFLRRFSPPQQVYLREQLKVAGIGYLIVTWSTGMILSVIVLNIYTLGHPWLDPSAKLWFMYVRQVGSANQILRIFCLMAAALALMPLRFPQFTQLYRARPLSRGFLFWARVLPLAILLTAAVATGIAISFAVIAAVKGPIWQHLPPTIPRVLGPDDADVAQDYRNLLVTSLPVMALFSVVTATLTFSTFLALVALPLNRFSVRTQLLFFLAPLCFLAFLAPPAVGLVQAFTNTDYPHVPFFYSDFGPPPHVAFALVPIALSAGLLFLAQAFVSRVEV